MHLLNILGLHMCSWFLSGAAVAESAQHRFQATACIQPLPGHTLLISCMVTGCAGLPRHNTMYYCPSWLGDRCFFLNSTLDTYATHKANCQALGGYLASYNSALEQSSVDNRLYSTIYWIGVELVAQRQWVMADGTPVGNGVPSDADPYAHW
jgi:hypothetical protein